MPTLAGKLGFTPQSRSLVVGPVPDELVAGLFSPHRRATGAPYDVILAVCPDRRSLERQVSRLVARLTPAGALWLAWPKPETET